jgi:hypothetical protein
LGFLIHKLKFTPSLHCLTMEMRLAASLQEIWVTT